MTSEKRKEMVVGFAFHGDSILLIRKNRPDWQKNKLNGIGGKIEPGETPQEAMVREFYEETGLVVEEEKLAEYGMVTGLDNSWRVYFFSVNICTVSSIKQMTDEVIMWVKVRDLHTMEKELVGDLLWWLGSISVKSTLI